jgi:hypothetical protein
MKVSAPESGWGLTLPAAARGLDLTIENIGPAAVSAYCSMKQPYQFDPWAEDRINDLRNADAFVIEPGVTVTLTCSENGRWLSS